MEVIMKLLRKSLILAALVVPALGVIPVQAVSVEGVKTVIVDTASDAGRLLSNTAIGIGHLGAGILEVSGSAFHHIANNSEKVMQILKITGSSKFLTIAAVLLVCYIASNLYRDARDTYNYLFSTPVHTTGTSARPYATYAYAGTYR